MNRDRAIANDNMASEAWRRWVILFVIYLCMLAYAFILQSVPPILSLVITDFNLSHAQGGLLMSFFALPGIIISIPAGILADRYSQKAIGVISLALMIGGAAIFATANSMLMLSLGRTISGIGAIFLGIMAPQLLAQWFIGYEMGIAMGIFNTAVPLGTILSLNFLSLLAQNLSWRASIWLTAGVSLLALVLFALLFAPARKDRHTLPPSESLWQSVRLTGVPIWFIGIAWLLFNAVMISFFTFTPDMLTKAGFSVASAGFLTGVVMWPALLLSPAIGYVMDRIGHKRAIIAIGGIALAILMFWVPTATGWMLTLMLLIGAAQATVPAPIFALPPEVTSPERLGLAFGTLSICLSLGIVVGPAAAGLLKDITGTYQASYILASGFAILIALTMVFLRRKPVS